MKGGSCAYYEGCPSKAQVAFCTFQGMAHVCAGGPSGHLIADASRENAGELAWAFWKQYAR